MFLPNAAVTLTAVQASWPASPVSGCTDRDCDFLTVLLHLTHFHYQPLTCKHRPLDGDDASASHSSSDRLVVALVLGVREPQRNGLFCTVTGRNVTEKEKRSGRMESCCKPPCGKKITVEISKSRCTESRHPEAGVVALFVFFFLAFLGLIQLMQMSVWVSVVSE